MLPRRVTLPTRFVGGLALFILAALPLRAAEVLDQSNDLTGSAAADSTSGGFQEVAQTFTVGVTGTLTRVELQLVRFFGTGGDVIVSLYETSGSFPTGNSLASQSLAWNLIPSTGYAYQVFDFSAASIPMTAGTVMALGVSSSIGGATGGTRSSFDMSTYAGGEAKFRVSNPNGHWQSFSFSHDYGFKTYVDVASQGLPGDYNDDGQVDAADYVVWRKHLGAPDETALAGNGDGLNGVDQGDYDLWTANFGRSDAAHGSTHGPFAVPEPATDTALMFVLALAWLTSNRRQQTGSLNGR